MSNLPSVRRAVIDVGTNSIKVLVAEINGQEITPLWEESRQTRLGQGFYATHRLQSKPIEQTAEAVASFARKARELAAGSVRVLATSAAREARNPEELLEAVDRAAGLRVEIISGEQEAEWAFQGVTSDPALAREPLLLLDVGGGSTEFILGHGRHKDFQESFPLGTVRLLEAMPHSDPPRSEELHGCREHVQTFLQTRVAPKLWPAMKQEQRFTSAGARLTLVGTGGTASLLGCMEAELTSFDRQRLEATRLSRERLQWQLQRLWSLSLAERRQLVGLPPNRADVILTGVAIYEGVMEQFGFEELRLSTRGLRFGALLD
jgi:exopolyphosphatase/guanosine-5'-triphosphate,3'-diphosphate pyrophosphatase